MTTELVHTLLFGLVAFIVAVTLGGFIFRLIRYRGLKGAIFGATIEGTFGVVKARGSSKLVKMSLKVHRLEDPKDDKAVGLEVVGKTLASFQMMPVALSASEAKELAVLLEAAAKDRRSRS